MAVCSTVLPSVHADLCDDQAFYGEISQFYFTRLGDDLTLYTDDAECATRLSNTTALPASPALAPIPQLFGFGSISDPERPAIKLSRKCTKYGSAKFTLVFNVDDTGATNWTFLPIPLRPEEVAKIMNRMEAEAPKMKFDFQIGEKVRIGTGPFADFIGTVRDIMLNEPKYGCWYRFLDGKHL